MHRDQHEVGDTRRAVYDDVIDIACQFGRFAVERIARQADDAEQTRQTLMCALLRPVERRALRVRVDQRNAAAAPGEFAGEVERKRRLADAALLIEERDDHRAPPGGSPSGS